MTTQKYLAGSASTLVAAATMQNMANNANVTDSAYNNVAGGGGADGYVLCRVTADFKFQSSPTANTDLSLWFLRARDPSSNSNYEDGSTSFTPVRSPDVIFPVSADTNAHRVSRDVLLPAGYLTPLVKNNGTGQALTNNASDNFVTICPLTYQAV